MRVTEIVKNNPEEMSKLIAEKLEDGWRFVKGKEDRDYLLSYKQPAKTYVLNNTTQSVKFIELGVK